MSGRVLLHDKLTEELVAVLNKAAYWQPKLTSSEVVGVIERLKLDYMLAMRDKVLSTYPAVPKKEELGND